MLASSSRELPLALDDVVLVFACNELFVPYLSVALQSILVNTSPKRHYDIVVLTRDITPKSMITLTQQASKYNVGLGFLDVDAALGDIKLPHHGHFRPETYFRLLAPTLLDNVEKAIYLDSDIVVCADVAELFDTDVTGYLLAATRDADTIGQIDGYDPTVYSYLKDQLGMTEPHDYFQAGVLLMNLEKFRQTITAEELLDIATERTWHWLDQDVLNKVVDGHYRRVHMKWNYLVDWQYMRRTHIVAHPGRGAGTQGRPDEYDDGWARLSHCHYAGPDNRPALPRLRPRRPLLAVRGGSPRVPYETSKSPQHRRRHGTPSGTSLNSTVEVGTPAVAIYRGIMHAFDYTCPHGKRRIKFIEYYERFGGSVG